MVRTLLTLAGFEQGVNFTETRFIKPPAGSYCVYLDDWNRYGSDNSNLVTAHAYTVELYAPRPDKDAEHRIEQAFDDLGISFEKQARYWIQDEQIFQTIYEFEAFEK